MSQAYGSALSSFAVSIGFKAIAMALPPPCDPAKTQLFLLRGADFTARSATLLSALK